MLAVSQSSGAGSGDVGKLYLSRYLACDHLGNPFRQYQTIATNIGTCKIPTSVDIAGPDAAADLPSVARLPATERRLKPSRGEDSRASAVGRVIAWQPLVADMH